MNIFKKKEKKFQYQINNSLKKRKNESERILLKYINKIPIIVEKSNHEKNLPFLPHLQLSTPITTPRSSVKILCPG